MSRIKKKNRPIQDDYICDDRLDVQKLREEINGMTDEEFEAYLKQENEKIIVKKLNALAQSGIYSLAEWKLTDEETVNIENAEIGDDVRIETALRPALFSNKAGDTIFVYAYTTKLKIPRYYCAEYTIQLTSLDYIRTLVKAIKSATNKKVILLIDSGDDAEVEIPDELLLKLRTVV